MPRETLVKYVLLSAAVISFGGSALGYAMGDYVTSVLPTAQYADSGYSLPDQGTALAQQGKDIAVKASKAAYVVTPDDLNDRPSYYRAIAY